MQTVCRRAADDELNYTWSVVSQLMCTDCMYVWRSSVLHSRMLWLLSVLTTDAAACTQVSSMSAC